MTLKEFKQTIQEFGFERGKILGIWYYKFAHDIEVCIFIKGNFWVSKKGRKEFTSNYKTISLTDLLEKLLKITKIT